MKRIEMTKCEWPGCDGNAHHYVSRKSYCEGHHGQALLRGLQEAASSGVIDERLKNFLGRWVVYWRHLQDDAPEDLTQLTKAKVEQRAEILLEDGYILFGIERHRKPIAVTHWFRLNLTTGDIEAVRSIRAYLTVAEFSEQLRLSKYKVRRLIRENKLGATKAGEIQSAWIAQMWADGRDHIPWPKVPLQPDLYKPWNTYLIPHSEVERFRSEK